MRHEEAGAFAAAAQAQLTGTLGVCMGTVGPGSIHLLNGLYDAKKSHAPVLAICGQVPLAELGTDFFQEVDNDRAVRRRRRLRRTLTSPEQMPIMLELAVQCRAPAPRRRRAHAAGRRRRPRPAPRTRAPPGSSTPPATVVPDPAQLADAARAIDEAGNVALLVGIGAREARDEVLALADRLAAPMVLTLKAKEGLEHDNPFQVGQTGLIGNPAARAALEGADLLLMLGTDFPYRDWYPAGKVVIQVDERGEHIGRRTAVASVSSGDAGLAVAALLERVAPKADRAHLDAAPSATRPGAPASSELTDPAFDRQRDGQARALEARQPRARASAPRRSPPPSTATPPPTRSSPPTRGCRRSGSRAS